MGTRTSLPGKVLDRSQYFKCWIYYCWFAYSDVRPWGYFDTGLWAYFFIGPLLYTQTMKHDIKPKRETIKAWLAWARERGYTDD